MSNVAFCRGRREIPLCQQTPVSEVLLAEEFQRHLIYTRFGPWDEFMQIKQK